jgi:hypothetical protein
LLKFKPDTPQLRAGSLLAMRGADSEPWTLCAIRWLQDNTREVLVGVEVLSGYAEAKLCIDEAEKRQAPLISYQQNEQQLVFIPLGHTDSRSISQLNVNNELWVLSAVRELGEDWEMRTLLDTVVLN